MHRAEEGARCSCSEAEEGRWIEAREKWMVDDRSPEVTSGLLLPEVDSSSLSVALSGGGMRSFALAAGQIRALTDRHSSIRYLSASSGGAWFALSYWASKGDAATELGEITAPGDLRLEDLRRPCGALRARAATSIGSAVHQKLIKRFWIVWKTKAFERALETTIEEAFGLADSSLTERRASDRPYVIVGITVLGEWTSVPFEETERRYRCFEASPLCFGVPGLADTAGGRRLGGWIETKTMGATRRDQACSLFLMPKRVTATTLATYAGLAHADFVCSHQRSRTQAIGRLLSAVNLPLWCDDDDDDDQKSPVDFVVGDGGIVDNLNLLPLVRRDGVRDILALCNFETPLNVSWNPSMRLPEYDVQAGSCLDIDASLASYFGINVVPDSDRVGYFLKHNQCFDQSAFAPLVTRLQSSASIGCGAVAAIDLTTIQNDYYGVPAGLPKRLIVVYLGRCEAWEAKINDPLLKKYLVPTSKIDGDETNADKTHLVDDEHTPFPRFPHLAASGPFAPPFDNAAVNLLACFGGFILQENMELLDAIRERPFGFFRPEDNVELDKYFPASFFSVERDRELQRRLSSLDESAPAAEPPQHTIQRERIDRYQNPLKKIDALIDGR